MKRLIPAAVLLILIIMTGLISGFTVRRQTQKTKTEIETCKQLYTEGKTEAAAECAIAFKKRWFKSARRMSAFTNHRPLDEISLLASVLPGAVKTENSFEVYYIVSRIETELGIINKEESLNLESLY